VTASDHHECQPDIAAGCQRCIVSPSLICCEVCNPHLFEGFAVVNLTLRPKSKHPRSRLQKVIAIANDMALRDALHTFRRQRTIDKFGLAALKNQGPGIIMPTEILQRIVDCAHHNKITSIKELEQETSWSRAAEYGDEILLLIRTHQHQPPPPTPSAANGQTLTMAGSSHEGHALAKTMTKRLCSKCGSGEHIGRLELYYLLL
jgi:hypothetical protein